MSKPLVLNHLMDRIKGDLAELGVHAPTAAAAIAEGNNNYQKVGYLRSDLTGLGIKRHYFHLTTDEHTSEKGDGRYVFRQIHTNEIPEAVRPSGYTGDVLIPVWVSNRKRLHPDYRVAKNRIVANKEKLYLSEEQTSRIRTE